MTHKGITSYSIETLGACLITLKFPEENDLDHKFQIVSTNFPITCAGILGKDLLHSYGCKLDLSASTIEIGNSNKSFEKFCFHFNSSYVVPARSETIIRFKLNCDDKFEYICPSQEIKPGVYIASSIVKVFDDFIALSLINSNENSENLCGCSIQLDSVKNYHVYYINQPKDVLEERFTKLEKELDLTELNDEVIVLLLK